MELSKRITNAQDLEDLGITGLKLPEFMIKAALYDHSNSIQAATHKVISSWVQQQSNRQKAYIVLHTGLKDAKMHQIAGDLQLWVEGTLDQTPASLDRGVRLFCNGQC